MITQTSTPTAEATKRLRSFYNCFINQDKDRWENELMFAYRWAIANGNFEGGNAKHMMDIDVVVTNSGAAKVFFKNELVGVYNHRSVKGLMNVRPMIDGLLNEYWFQEKIKIA